LGSDFGRCHSPNLGNPLRDVSDIGWFISFPAALLWREKGSVSFYKYPIQGCSGNHIS
jgi:hypothetical protein